MHGGAHPRAYGENPAPISARTQSGGSSPRIRGKRTLRIYNIGRAGLIPAHTGKTRVRVLLMRQLRAHPRAYGENQRIDVKVSSEWGSSPRIRGKPTVTFLQTPSSGLIPAHTGKTSPDTDHVVVIGAHPRAYGENTDEVAA